MQHWKSLGWLFVPASTGLTRHNTVSRIEALPEQIRHGFDLRGMKHSMVVGRDLMQLDLTLYEIAPSVALGRDLCRRVVYSLGT